MIDEIARVALDQTLSVGRKVLLEWALKGVWNGGESVGKVAGCHGGRQRELGSILVECEPVMGAVAYFYPAVCPSLSRR